MRTEVETGPSTVDFRPTEHVEFVLLVIPDANGSLRGKALRPDAFEAAVRHGTVMTDLLLALDPVDVPISDYGKFGIRSGAADLVVHPDTSTLHDLRWRPGCIGLHLAARPAIDSADNAAYLKFAVKELARSMGMRASFLAKTAPGEEGSSGHVHLSCWRDGANAFAGGDTMRPAIAGVLEHLPAASLLLNPTINSYKRLVPGYFAPTNVSWGVENRSCAVRAIHSARSELNRFECRRPGADANPYLALAAIVASAADGLRRGAPPPEPLVGDAYSRTDLAALPASLEESLHAFQADGALRQALGEEFGDYYAVSRRWELKAWQQTVTEWERER